MWRSESVKFRRMETLSISKGELIQLIEKLPEAAQVTTYYYLKDMATTSSVDEDLLYDYDVFVKPQEINEEKTNWVHAYLEFYLES